MSLSVDPSHGALALQQLRNTSWLRRRVETITFHDDTSTRRNITLDIDYDSLTTGPEFQATATPVPVCLLLLRKGLMDEFSLRDEFGNTIATLNRAEDARLAFGALVAAAKEQDLGEEVITCEHHLCKIAYNFPQDELPDNLQRRQQGTLGRMQSWKPRGRWTSEQSDAFDRLILNDTFKRLLLDFTFNFLLAARLPIRSSYEGLARVLKVSYLTAFDWRAPSLRERFLLQSAKVKILLPEMSDSASSHIRFEAPPNVRFSSIRLALSDASQKPTNSLYQTSLTGDRAHVYAADLPRREYVVTIGLRVPMVGLLRAITAAITFTTLVLWASFAWLSRLEGEKVSVEAATALLLVTPGIVAAYLVNPGEHQIASRLLRPLRSLVVLCSLLSYISASVLLLRFHGFGLRVTWGLLSVIASGCFAVALLSAVAERISSRKMRPEETSSHSI